MTAGTMLGTTTTAPASKHDDAGEHDHPFGRWSARFSRIPGHCHRPPQAPWAAGLIFVGGTAQVLSGTHGPL